MDLLGFVVMVVLVTASGALAPGPLFFATVSHGAQSGARTGFVFSVAHTVVEFSLVMLFALGLLTVASEPVVKLGVGVAGGVVLVGFGMVQIYKSMRAQREEMKQDATSSRSLFLIGLAFTGLNPYFVLWWLTVGAELILIALEFAALVGVVVMYVCHVWMDYVWLTGVAYFAKRGTDVVGLKWYRVLMVVFGGVLIYFGLSFFLGALGV